MKKLNKLVMSKAKIMSVPELKNITGGYDGESDCSANGQCDGTKSCTTSSGTAGTCDVYEVSGVSLCACYEN